MNELSQMVYKIQNTVKPVLAFCIAIFSYLVIPEKCFEAWSIALWVSVALDLITRWFAIFMKSKGVIPAFKTKAFNSDTLFRKTAVKVIAYLVIQILAGLSFRVITVVQINVIMAAIIYSFLFIRELASNIENLIEAGAEDLRPLLFWIKKKEKEVLNEKGKKKLSNLKQSVWEKAVKITSQFEGWLSGNFDGQYLSFGYLQWNFGQGTLQPMFKRLFVELPDIPCLPDASLRNAIADGTEKEWALTIQEGNVIVEPWYSALKTLYTMPEWISIMDDAAVEYKNQAILLCQRFSQFTDRAFCLMFDIAVQCWTVKAMPSDNSLSAIVDALILQCPVWWEDVYKRKMAIVNSTNMGRGWANVEFDDENMFESEVEVLDWKQIIEKVSSSSVDWENAITVAVNAAKAEGDLGALEIFQYLPELIIKLYNTKG